MAIPNVVIFGETGAGKSSLVNLIGGNDVAQISSRCVGCTFQSTCYTVNIGGKQFKLHDTAGLDEGQGGTVAKHDAIVQLYTLLRKLDSGVSLLVFCMRGPRIKESCVKNWRMFWEIICQRRVPILLAVTGLENEENGMDVWWTQNEEHFVKYEMYPNGVACLTATRGKRRAAGGYKFDEEYEESQEKIRSAIGRVYLRNPWQVAAIEWFKMIIDVSFTSGKHPKEIRKSREVLGSATEELVRRCEMSTEEANELARKLHSIQI
jgi:GTPase SAR1 family protein